MVITKSQGVIFLILLTGLAVVARTGVVVDLMLVSLAAMMMIPLVFQPQMPARVKWVMVAFALFFLLYAALTVVRPSGVGIVNVVGIVIAATFFLYFAQMSPRLIASPHTGEMLFLSGCLIALIGVGLGLVNKNTVSGIVCYFFLAAGIVWVAQGASLRRIGFWVSLAIVILGLVIGHRLMMGAGAVFGLIVLVLRLVPLESLRSLLLLGIFGGILLMIALYAGLWGLDIRNIDSFIIEYTGRTARSGRQIIWPFIIALTAQSPWFGLNTGAVVSSYITEDWSAHSYFLQVYMQVGLVGVGIFVALLVSLWAAIGRPRRGDTLRIFVTACFAVLLIHISFEVFLMQVNLFMGCAAWMMLGLGIGAIRSDAAAPVAARATYVPLSLRAQS